MSTKVNKKAEIVPRFHLVYAWCTRTRRYVHIASSFSDSSNFNAVSFLRDVSFSVVELWRDLDLDIDSAISMPCSVWEGFSTNELPF